MNKVPIRFYPKYFKDEDAYINCMTNYYNLIVAIIDTVQSFIIGHYGLHS